MSYKLCILVCEFFKQEAFAVIQSEGFADAVVIPFPARCGRPPVTWDEVDQIVRAHADCDIHLLGGCCIAGLNKEHEKEAPTVFFNHEGHEGHEGREVDQCFYMFAGREIIDNYLKEGAYLLTPGWVKGWRDRFKEWGFEQNSENGREFFNESAARLVLLDTGIDPKSHEHLKEFAEFVGRPFEVLPVGLDFFRLYLAKILLEWRLEEKESVKTTEEARRRIADYAMSLELLSSLAGVMTSTEAAAHILNLFVMLFAPKKVFYVPIEEGKPGEILSSGVSPDQIDSASIESRLVDFHGDYAWTDSGKGFRVRIAYKNETLGVVEVDEIAFSKYREHYLNLALSIARVCGLALKNASTYQQMKHAEEQIKASLEEKEVLLREIHHRVKNNLQTISSLLSLQSRYIKDEQMLDVFKNSQERVRSMALIHEKLYQSRDLSKINFPEYIRSLIKSLFDSYHLKRGKVQLKMQIQDITLDINTSIPLGLIINELVSNTLKHAFPASRKGELRVSLGEKNGKKRLFVLIVEDTGIGFPGNLDFQESSSLGMRLVNALVKQLHGAIELDRTNGTRFTLKFEELNYH